MPNPAGLETIYSRSPPQTVRFANLEIRAPASEPVQHLLLLLPVLLLRDQALVPQPLELLQALLNGLDREPGGFGRRRRRRESRRQGWRADNRPCGQQGLKLDDDLRLGTVQQSLEQPRISHHVLVLPLHHFIEWRGQRAQRRCPQLL